MPNRNRFRPTLSTLETRNAPSAIIDIPFPDPIDYPEDIPPYEPPSPPGGPSTPKAAIAQTAFLA